MYGKACGFETIRLVPEEFRVREICEVKLARHVRQGLQLRGIGEASANTLFQRGHTQRGSRLWTSRSIRCEPGLISISRNGLPRALPYSDGKRARAFF